MKNLYIILLSAFALTSCEEVIDLNLDTAPKKLIEIGRASCRERV